MSWRSPSFKLRHRGQKCQVEADAMSRQLGKLSQRPSEHVIDPWVGHLGVNSRIVLNGKSGCALRRQPPPGVRRGLRAQEMKIFDRKLTLKRTRREDC
jgi:hypothetical protein